MGKRKIYLEDIPLDAAWRRFVSEMESADRWRPLSGEDVMVDQALGRVTSEAVWAAVSSPGYHASAMDGYAVHSQDTVGATEGSPVRLTLGPDGQARYVDTGDPLPSWADAVIVIEQVEPFGEGAIEIRSSVAPWTAVRTMGEDMVATELVLPANHVLTPVDLGAIAGCGHPKVKVRRKPRVAIIPTGTELITVEQAAERGLGLGDIIEYNSLVLSAQVRSWGGESTRYPILPDDYGRILDAVREAASRHDLVLVIAGASAGSEDFTAQVVEEAGRLIVHGIAVRPGHPVVLGTVELGGSAEDALPASRVPVIGVPGYPVSCALTGEMFVEPVLSRWLGLTPRRKPTVRATMTRKLLSPTGDDEWVRVTVGKVGEKTVAAPLSRGAGIIMSLVRADGIVRIPRFSEGVDAGREVTVELYREPEAIERTIVHIGSHDLCLDVLAELLAGRSRRLASANAGSLGGLLAVKRGEAHLAGTHLLDPKTGEYNLSYLEKHLPGTRLALVTFVHREQGLMVAPGNPKRIGGLADLARPDIRFVNRQRGAGTRVLLDYRLQQIGVAPHQVRGYEREEYTHLAVAAAIQSGVADCGLGIAAAARSLGLEFIPLEKERYDLAIPRDFYDGELLRPLLEVIQEKEFRELVGRMPGYDTAHTGEVVIMTA